jgi:hypothetical protein
LLAFVLAFVLALAGSGDGDDLCDRLAGVDFRSEEQISAVLGPDGVEPAYEFVDFEGDEALWLYSDIIESGPYECSGNQVSFLDDRFEAVIVEEDGRLVLDRDGVRYLEEQ